jgi:(2Fe-2S) ferredoxin
VTKRKYEIVICSGPECGDKRGSARLLDVFRTVLAGAGVRAELGWQACFGRCRHGPNVLVRELAGAPSARRSLATPAPSRGGSTALYNGITEARVAEIIEGHLVGGRIQRQLIERVDATASRPVTRDGRGPSREPSGDS